ncbi:hypothetical protein [Marinobacter sp. MBR-105]|jgi:hypothetical protein
MSNITLDSQDKTKQPSTKALAFGARLSGALIHARLSPAGLYRRLNKEYPIKVSRTSVYDAVNGRVEQPRFVHEAAEITGVNLQWLKTGRGMMVDMTGRLSKKETAVRDVKRLLRQHVIPDNRSDLIRLSDQFLVFLESHSDNKDRIQMLALLLSDA